MKIRERSANQAEAGYNLVMLLVAITVVNILLAASLPLWSRVIQHDKEEELIFRGLQYAEAIRVFRIRFQRAPVRIEELLESKPRCIRQLWKDPMSKDGKWKILYEGVPQVPGALTPQGEGKGEENAKGEGKEGKEDSDDSGRAGGSGDDAEGGSGFLSTEQKEQLTIGPIDGVVSKSNKRSAMIWTGAERYDQWLFRWSLVAQQKSVVIAAEGAPPTPQGESLRWIGRPWPKWLGIQSAPPPPSGLNSPGGLGGGPGGGRQPPPNPGGGAGGGEGGGAFGVPGGLPPDPDDPPPPS